MAHEHDWWTSPTESEDGRLIMVSGRRDIGRFRDNKRFCNRIEITWRYDESPDAAMPDKPTAEMMEKVTDALNASFDKDPVAVMTGIFTGAGERNWVFYTLSNNIFGRKINEALADLPLLPLTIYAELDPDWAAYDEMCDLAEIMPGDEC